ncbi:hypothetical protein [Pedobacter mendelii]|uniref:Uncharacterized protein n=1 Tax=Pedobacter mendelii TaxID=1908240 RepID=A0ABQ2BJG8_9SPHI|nr:hypothetical protein [Pedobacter mendelii]GGI27581.1 hypothetical protein GCM10008119_28370 [Pedobacter mendelii]
MSTKQIYANRFGNEIFENQVNKLGDYLLKHYDDEILTKIETYSKGVLVVTSYNLISHDNVQSILDSDPHASFQIESQQGDYKLFECLSYKDKILVDKQIYVEIIPINETICRHYFDLPSNAIKHTSTIKIYYDLNGKELYEFEYNADGTCFHINNLQEYQSDFYAHNIGVDPDLEFTWQGFEYYQFSEPLIPTGPII